jgi:hypothetical protein
MRALAKVGFDALAEAVPNLPAPSKGDLQTPDECVAEMTAAGFRDVVTHTVSGSARFESPERYLALQEATAARFRCCPSAWASPPGPKRLE